MEKLSLNEIRRRFLGFFASKEHLVLPSFSLIPKDDPSILLNNAGMTPMKKWFTGEETPPRLRVATCQKCIRTPDIDNVGYTARHGTFFEMLGNFSFNDYFKQEAISWAWEFITEDLKIPAEQLYVSVYLEDDEAYGIWHDKIGLSDERIFRMGKEDNFWEHGVGPCGPCSEIFFDRGLKYGCGKADCQVGCECDRFVEIWNLVFTQFKRQEDGSYVELSSKNIDTGAGLERFAMVMQDEANLFEVDTVRAILEATAKIAGVKYHEDETNDVSLRVITDHIRSSVFMLADGVRPSNEGRGYVLRRLIRRAAARGLLLNIDRPFLTEIAEVAIAQSEEAYPELAKEKKNILKHLGAEEDSFRATVENALPVLRGLIEKAKKAKKALIAGADLFKLHDTFGLPIELSNEFAENAGVKIDRAGFDREMAEQKERARKHQQELSSSAWSTLSLPQRVKTEPKTEFRGYEETFSPNCRLLAILQSQDEQFKEFKQSEAGQEYFLIFDSSPFYAEAGGQIADTGVIKDGQQILAEVLDCQKQDGYYLHQVRSLGSLDLGQEYSLEVDAERRLAIKRNHTATHLLHAALRKVLGEHVEQRGSLVHPDYLRFDFAQPRAMTAAEIAEVEDLVNLNILANTEVETRSMPLKDAQECGAMALFGEKYADVVRVLSIGDFSLELCGGTHLSNTAETGLFTIVSESGISAGVRRIVAVTGEAAFKLNKEERQRTKELAGLLKVPESDLTLKLNELLHAKHELELEIRALKKAQNKDLAGALEEQITCLGELKVLLAKVDDLEVKDLRDLSDRLMQNNELDFLLLLSPSKDKVLLLAKASDDAIKAGYKAGNLVREAAQICGGSGGGKPSMAQAGGKDPSKVDEAIASIRAKFA
ncbi:MAG: alanine--tRNA ligase [Eubacteriales bacterium]|nr:alanine--tRNA ligase [Eubacteriales bacterium]